LRSRNWPSKRRKICWGLALQRVDDVDEAARRTGGEGLRLDLLDHGLRELLQLLLRLLLGLP
jgi:hypothetical protein